MPLGPAAQSALIEWINTFPLSSKVESWTDLSDGFVLSETLAVIDPSYSVLSPSRSSKLQAVVNGLFRYIRTECDGLDPLLETPGLKALSDGGKSGPIFEILIILLMAAISGRHREKYITSITRLEAGVQSEIAKIIQQKQHDIGTASISTPSNEEPGAPPSNDYELEFEVRYSALIAQKRTLEEEKDRLRKQTADMTTRLERLQNNNDLLQERLTAAEDGLSGAARDEDAAKVIKGLEAKVREQEELIANQESQVEQDRIEKMTIRKELDRLMSSSELVLQLQDENKELQYQNLELTKKANTLDRYKQKLESQRDFQADIKNLELENEELKIRSRDFEMLKHRNESLEATHVQFQNTLGRREMEIFELSSQKKTLDEEKADLQRTVMRLEEAKVVDDAYIHDLKDQLNGTSPLITSSIRDSLGNLEDELEQTNQSGTMANLELSRLRAENQILKGNATAAQEVATLRIELEEAERIRKRDEAKYNELFEKNIIATQQVSAILGASTAEGLVKGVNAAMLLGQLDMLTPEYYSSEVFSKLRQSYLSASEKLSTAERKVQELEAGLEDTKRQLLTANTDLSMIAKDDIDALEELKATQETLALSFEADLKKLKNRNKDLEVDYEQQKSQLIEALISKDKLQQKVTGTQDKETNAADRKAAIEQVKDVVDRSALEIQLMTENCQKKDGQIWELEARIRKLEAGGNDTKKTALDQELTNMRREYNMMLTAWYDLTARLQSNNVVLQRRQDAPRSWINRQRQAVNTFGKRS